MLRLRLLPVLSTCVALVAATLVAAAVPASAAVNPTLRWTKELNGAVRESSPLAVNLDGSNDVVVGTHAGALYAIHPDGTDVPGWPVTLGDAIDSSPSAADTDNDGTPEVYVGAGVSSRESGDLYAIDRGGRLRWKFNPTDPHFNDLSVFSTPSLGDVNGDGTADVSAFALGLQAWSFTAAGALNKGWPFYTDDTVFSSPAIVDVDGNGISDYVVGGDSTPGGPTDVKGGVLRAIRGNGSVIWQVNFNEIVRSSPAVGDIDADGQPDIVVGTGDYWVRSGPASDANKIFAFDLNGRLKWSRDLGAHTLASAALADVDGNGTLDVIEGTWEGSNPGKIFVLDGHGNPLPGWDGRTSPGGIILGQISTADLDADGGQDLVVGTGGGVWAFSGKTAGELFSVQTGLSAYQNAPLLTDLDGNGTLSLVVAGTRPNGTGIVSRYDLPVSAQLGSRGWAQFRKDNRRTGSTVATPLATNLCATAPTEGYWLAAADGGVFGFCGAGFYGSAGAERLKSPVVGMTRTPSSKGYWLVASDGGIFAYGDAGFHGSTGDRTLNKPITGMASSPSGRGYWLVASDGGIFAFGDAGFHGSTGDIRLNRPITGMAPTPSGRGYWLVASDGGIFAFGDAGYYGSTGALNLNQPITGMTATPSGHGYWLVASDGGIFAFGDAGFYGSTGDIRLNEAIVGISRAKASNAYRMVARDGGIFSFNAAFLGSTGALSLNSPIVAISTPN